jgi:putative MATE family efflux protein
MFNPIAKLKATRNQGESFKDIFAFWLPELISATILISLPPVFDAWVITRLGSTTLYGALGMGTNFLHTLIKLAEAIPVASIAIIGRYNGANEHEKCGEGLGDTFWTTFLLGVLQFIFIFFAATSIYRWIGVPEDMVACGAPFLRLKSFGVLLIFIALGLMGFMRAVKNTRMPMIINLVGIASFIFFDYTLVLGKFGMPALGLTGSALATIIQYVIMNAIALAYILTNPDYKKYFTKMFFMFFNIKQSLHLLQLSWPIIIDKSTIAFAYVWLSKMIAPMGKYAITSYDVVKNLERFAFLPVMASAGIITFLVSNSLGARDYDGTMANIKKVFALTLAFLVPALLIICFNATYFASFFDPKHEFSAFVGATLPIISLLVIFDFMQVFFSGALRGAGDVKFVMWSRVFTIFCFFIPISYFLSTCTFSNPFAKFIMIYGSFYVTTGIMGITFLVYIKSLKWQKTQI